MPAAAVIPALIAYIKVVAVKKLVVESWACLAGPLNASTRSNEPFLWGSAFFFIGGRTKPNIYFEKIRVFKAGLCSNILAWNNRIGRMVLFCWFLGPS